MDAVVARPYGISTQERDRDYAAAWQMENEFVSLVARELNRIHSVEHSDRYWMILMRHWLKRFVDVVFNRYHTLAQCLGEESIREIAVLEDASYTLAVTDSFSFVWATNDDVWNSVLYGRVRPFVQGAPPARMVQASLGGSYRLPEHFGPPPRMSLARRLRRVPGLIRQRLVVRGTDSFIFNTYMQAEEEVLLQRGLGQTPRRWHSHHFFGPSVDPDLRRELSASFSGDSSGLMGCMRALLFELIPVCYLEGYRDLVKKSESMPWPDRPRLIFTSGNYDTDEIFKCWTASRVERGSRYMVGQHGNNYGTHRYIAYRTTDQLTSDRFLTWGWRDSLPSHTPAFILRTSGFPELDPAGGLLLAEDGLPNRVYTWDIFPDYTSLINEQFEFVRALPPAIKERLLVRLHGPDENLDRFGDELRWNDFDRTVNLERGKVLFADVVRKSRIVVFGYDSTGMLESLASNSPMIAFWSGGLSHLKDHVKPQYEWLIDAGIVHLSGESAARKIGEIWDNVNGWWQSEAVQSARVRFCEIYARTSQTPAADLLKIIKDDL